MQVVPLGLFIFQLAVADVSLPDRVGAPETVGLSVGMEAIRLGECSLLVGLGHQPMLAVDVAGGAPHAALRARAFTVAGAQAEVKRMARHGGNCAVPHTSGKAPRLDRLKKYKGYT